MQQRGSEGAAERDARKAFDRRWPRVLEVLVVSVFPLALLGSALVLTLNYRIDALDASIDRSRPAFVEILSGGNLKIQASLAAHQIDLFIDERIQEARNWAKEAVVVEAAVKGAEAHEAEGLVGFPIDKVEEAFSTRKSLGIAPESDRFLKRQLNSSAHFAEIFFTDRNGFNVSITNPTSDFVQSDEGWWRGAWSHGISVSEVGYDDSAGVWSTDISVRLNHPDSRAPLGVMKSVLAIDSIQRLADRIARSVPGGRVSITTPDGLLIAETDSQHAVERIMNPEVNMRSEDAVPSLRPAFGPESQGTFSDEEWITGYAHTSSRRLYVASSESFQGLDWIVVVQSPVSGTYSLGNILGEAGDALRGWRTVLLVSLGGAMIASVLIVIAFGHFSARRFGASLLAMREMGERAMQGEDPSAIRIRHPGELAQLNETVYRLCRICAIVIRRRNRQRQP
ncbi:MAG: cache domain-containing protein [Chromatiales bacterium]|nr:cache domain-containing protein [Chromatiales bacterium]